MNDQEDRAESSADGLDLSSTPGIVAANQAGKLPEHVRQSREDYDAQVSAVMAETLRALKTGEVEAHTTRQFDYDHRAGTYLSRTRGRGGAWSRPQVVAVSRIRPSRASLTTAGRPTRREARPGQRGRRARRHAATTLRDDGDGPGGESDPPDDLDGDGPPPPARRGGLRPIRHAVVDLLKRLIERDAEGRSV